MNIVRFLLLSIFFKFNFLIAAEPLPFNNIVLHKNPLQVSQVKFKDFHLKDIQINKNDGKIKILNFWATWCAPCKKEMPSLDKLKTFTDFKDTNIIPINIGGDSYKKSKEFFDQLGIKNLQVFTGSGPEFSKLIG